MRDSGQVHVLLWLECTLKYYMLIDRFPTVMEWETHCCGYDKVNGVG